MQCQHFTIKLLNSKIFWPYCGYSSCISYLISSSLKYGTPHANYCSLWVFTLINVAISFFYYRLASFLSGQFLLEAYLALLVLKLRSIRLFSNGKMFCFDLFVTVDLKNNPYRFSISWDHITKQVLLYLQNFKLKISKTVFLLWNYLWNFLFRC